MQIYAVVPGKLRVGLKISDQSHAGSHFNLQNTHSHFRNSYFTQGLCQLVKRTDLWTLRTQDTSDLRQFDTSAEVSAGHFGPVIKCGDSSAMGLKCPKDSSEPCRHRACFLLYLCISQGSLYLYMIHKTIESHLVFCTSQVGTLYISLETSRQILLAQIPLDIVSFHYLQLLHKNVNLSYIHTHNIFTSVLR